MAVGSFSVLWILVFAIIPAACFSHKGMRCNLLIRKNTDQTVDVRRVSTAAELGCAVDARKFHRKVTYVYVLADQLPTVLRVERAIVTG